MDMIEHKTQTRKAAFAARKLAHAQQPDAAANDLLLEWIGPSDGLVIAGYMPIRTELSPIPAMSNLEGANRVAVPVIQAAAQPLQFHVWQSGCEMVEGPFGAAVPRSAVAVTPDIVIVPLVAFDTDLNRLGYGGGFYDRTLELLRAKRPHLRAVGFAYDAQQMSNIPLEPTDQPLDAIVTETRILK